VAPGPSFSIFPFGEFGLFGRYSTLVYAAIGD
jgi:hypothetical protein